MENQGQTDHVTIVANDNLNTKPELWPITLPFNHRSATINTHIQETYQGHRSVVSKDRVETKKDGHDRLHYPLPFTPTRLEINITIVNCLTSVYRD